MFRFETGKYYRSYNGKTIIQVVRRTEKSVYVNTHHWDEKEAFTYLKRIRIDSEGNEYITTKSNNIPIFAEFESNYGGFRNYIMSRIGKPLE